MQLFDKTVIVTGGGSGIGRALCDAFHQARAKRIVVADVDLKAAEHVAAKVGGGPPLEDRSGFAATDAAA